MPDISRDLLDQAAGLDRELIASGPGQTLILWTLNPPLAYAVGAQLTAFDREARRVSQLSDVSARSPASRPVPVGRAGFRVVDASPGSLDLLLAGIGVTTQILLSDPVQLALTVASVVNGARSIRSWIGGRRDPSTRITVAELTTVLDRLGADLVVRPRTTDEEPRTLPRRTEGVAAESVLTALEGGNPHPNAVVTVVRYRPDGSLDLVVIGPERS
jgi:hypothetical protein